jgi:hypothetical protein
MARRLTLRSRLVIPAVLAAALLVPAGAQAGVGTRNINSGGPLTNIWVDPTLSCQVSYAGDTAYEFYPSASIPGNCGTAVSVDGALYRSQRVPVNGTVFTQAGGTGVTGNGSSGSPFRISTTVEAGNSGIRLTEVVSYVAGLELYRTDLTIANSGASRLVRVYHAGDCYLQGSDVGYGFVEGSAAGCSTNPNNNPASRIEEFYPITGGNRFYEAGYSEVWQAISSQNPFPNTCRCTERIDQGAGLSWDVDVPSGGTRTVSYYTRFSPTGQIGPPTNVAPPTGGGGTVNITNITNNNVTFVQVFRLPSTRRCVSRRNFRITLRQPPRVQLIAASVRVNGRPTRVYIRNKPYITVRRGILLRKRLSARVDLRGFPAGRVRVDLRAVTKTFRVLRGVRRYRTCVPGRRRSSTNL